MEESGPFDPTTGGGDEFGTAFEESDGGMRALPATYGEDVGAPEGCGCRADAPSRLAWLGLGLALFVPRRRRG